MIIESLSRYRIDRSRIFFLGDQVVGRGGMARVHLATLLPSAESNEGAFKEPQTTAVKRLIFDPDTDDRQVIAVSTLFPLGCSCTAFLKPFM